MSKWNDAGPASRFSLSQAPETGNHEPASDRRACVLSGEIRSASTLCDVVSFLAHAGRWVELALEHGETTGSLYFDASHVVSAGSTAAAKRLGADSLLARR